MTAGPVGGAHEISPRRRHLSTSRVHRQVVLEALIVGYSRDFANGEPRMITGEPTATVGFPNPWALTGSKELAVRKTLTVATRWSAAGYRG